MEAGHSIIIDDYTWNESISVLRRKSRTLGLIYSPINVMEAYWANLGALHVPPHIDATLRGIVNRSDRQVVAAARANGATLLTDDHPLLLQAQKAGVKAVNALQAVAGNHPNVLDPQQAIHFGTPQVARPYAAGHVYFQVSLPHSPFPAGHKFTVFYLIGRVWVYFDTDQGAWIAEVDGLKRLSVMLNFGANERVLGCFSYRAGSSLASRPTYSLAVGTNKDNKGRDYNKTLKSIWLKGGVTQLNIGRSRFDADYLDGHIFQLLPGHGEIGEKVWNALLADASVPPSVFDANLLDTALLRVSVPRVGDIVRPSPFDLM